jgi:hypothetical protein
MKHACRLGGAVCLIGALGVLLSRSRCDLPPAEQFDDYAPPAPLRFFYEEAELSQVVDEKRQGAVRRRAAREEIVARLLAGELTLFDAAAHFRDLNAEAPEVTHFLRLRFPDLSAEHAVCRQVIMFVAEELTEAVARLEDELAEHLRRHGCIRLPDSPK